MNKYCLYCLLLGYLPGCILTAEIVCRKLTGKSASELGTSGNPGMANVMAHLGFKPGLRHDFPFWRGFRGGKGVAASCIAMFLGDPLTGLIANIAGMLTVFATKYLALGGLVIPAVYAALIYLWRGVDCAVPAIGFLLLTLITHRRSLMQIPAGTAEKVDVLGAIKRKFGRKKAAEDQKQ